MLTPYAVLLVKPSTSDDDIRRAYHAIARREHPDGTRAEPTPLWYEATSAYNAIKTSELRGAWRRARSILSGVCKPCSGCGVRGSTMFGQLLFVCEHCRGVGRV